MSSYSNMNVVFDDFCQFDTGFNHSSAPHFDFPELEITQNEDYFLGEELDLCESQNDFLMDLEKPKQKEQPEEALFNFAQTETPVTYSS